MAFLSIVYEVDGVTVRDLNIEPDVEAVVSDLEGSSNTRYFDINTDASGNPTIAEALVKGGARTSAPAGEVVEVEAGGSVVGSVERPVIR